MGLVQWHLQHFMLIQHLPVTQYRKIHQCRLAMGRIIRFEQKTSSFYIWMVDPHKLTRLIQNHCSIHTTAKILATSLKSNQLSSITTEICLQVRGNLNSTANLAFPSVNSFRMYPNALMNLLSFGQ